MKNIVAKLTLRQLKLNFRRTIITIIGIALSVTMLTATSSVVTSFLDGNIRAEIASAGEWHTRLNDMPMKNVNKIKDTIQNVDDVLMLEWDGFAPIPQKGEKRFFYIESYGKNTFDHFPVTIEEGRLPQKDGELIISEEAAKAGYKIGQTMTLELGYRGYTNKSEASDSGISGAEIYNDSQTMSSVTDGDENIRHLGFNEGYKNESDNNYEEKFYPTNSKTYTIVGVFSEKAGYYYSDKLSASPAYEAISFLDPATIKADSRVSPLILFDKLNTDIYKNTENSCKTLGAEDYSRHSALLQFYGLSNRSEITAAVYGFSAILVAIILIGSVAFIYNAFNISLADRSKYLGLLACVGATKKQKRFSVMLEGIILGAIAIPLGLLAGFGGIAVTLKLLSPYLQKLIETNVKFHLVIHPVTVIVSVLLGILTIFLSLIRPMRNAAKTSSIEAVRRSHDIKIKKKQIRTSFLTKKLFGFEGALAMKNIKRNPSRYRITIVSLVVSVVLFLTTVGAVDLAKNAFMAQMDYKEGDNNVIISYDNNITPKKEFCKEFDKVMHEIFETLSENPDTERITITDSFYAHGVISSNNVLDNEIVKDALFGIKLPDSENELIGVTVESFEQRYRDSNEISLLDRNKIAANEAILINYGGNVEYAEETGEKILNYDSFLKKAPKELNLWNVENADHTTDEFKNENGVRKLTRIYTDDASKKTEYSDYYCKPVSKVKIGAETNILFTGDRTNYYPTLVVRPELYNKLNNDFSDYIRADGTNIEISIRTDNANKACEIASEIAQKSGVSINIDNKEDELREIENLITLISVFSGGFITLIILICIANILNTIATGFMLRRREFAMLKSTGMTPKAFRRMVMYESLFYALKALLYGIPISMVIALGLKLVFTDVYKTTFISMFPWLALIIAAVSILVLVGSTAFYALRRIDKESIMDVLKDENT